MERTQTVVFLSAPPATLFFDYLGYPSRPFLPGAGQWSRVRVVDCGDEGERGALMELAWESGISVLS